MNTPKSSIAAIVLAALLPITAFAALAAVSLAAYGHAATPSTAGMTQAASADDLVKYARTIETTQADCTIVRVMRSGSEYVKMTGSTGFCEVRPATN